MDTPAPPTYQAVVFSPSWLCPLSAFDGARLDPLHTFPLFRGHEANLDPPFLVYGRPLIVGGRRQRGTSKPLLKKRAGSATHFPGLPTITLRLPGTNCAIATRWLAWKILETTSGSKGVANECGHP